MLKEKWGYSMGARYFSNSEMDYYDFDDYDGYAPEEHIAGYDDAEEDDEIDFDDDGYDASDASVLLNESDEFYEKLSAEEVRENFRFYVPLATNGTEEEKKYAYEMACKDLEGFIIRIAEQKFKTYLEKDHTFFDDLMQAGRQGIIMSLTKYDPEKTAPTTYFYFPIKHEMVEQVNKMKHDTKAYMATTKRKLAQIDKEFAQYGRKPTIHDYVFISGQPWKRVVTAIAERNVKAVKSSFDDPDAAPIIDKQVNYKGPEENAMSNFNASQILKIVKEVEPNEIIVTCFLESVLDNVKHSDLAAKYGIPIADISNGIRNIQNLLRYNKKLRKMYPERSRIDESEFIRSINIIPEEEGNLAMDFLLEAMEQDPEGIDGPPEILF